MKAPSGLHEGVAFPFNFALPPHGHSFYPSVFRVTVYTIIGAGAALGLLSLAILFLAAPGRSRPHPRLLRVQTVVIAVVALLLLLEQALVVQQFLAIVGMLVDSGLAKLDMALAGCGQALLFLGQQGSWAITSALVGLYLAYASRTARVASNPKFLLTSHTVIATYSTACVLSANWLFSAALRRFASHQADFFNALYRDGPVVSRAHIEGMTRAYNASIGCVLVAALLFWAAEKRRQRMVPPSPRGAHFIWRVGAGVCVLMGVVLTAFTQPLSRENRSPIPTDHAFANLTLSFPPQLGHLRGDGPDVTYGGDALLLNPHDAGRFGLPEASSPDQLYTLVRNVRELRHQLNQPEQTNLDLNIDPRLSPQQLREWLASVYWGAKIEHVALVMSDVISLDRPVLGTILGAKWTAARFEMRGQAYKCAQVRGPTIELTWPSSETTQSILQRIIQARRAGQTACVTVGDRACPSDEPRQPNCMDRLATPISVRRTSQPGDALRALRVALETAEFDVVEVTETRMIRLFSEGARTLPELRRELEKRHCSVHVTMNAGMFKPSYAPVGLLVTNSRVLQALDEGNGEGNFYLMPNGVFSVSRLGARVESSFDTPSLYGRLRVGTDNDWGAGGWYATQSGPIILTAGREHPAFDPHSSHRAIRNAVGVRERNDEGEPTRVLLAISNTPVTFHELAQLFTLFDCADALYLDGHVSRMDFPAFGRTVDDRKLGPMLAVAECPDD